jgi:hypothetical protein
MHVNVTVCCDSIYNVDMCVKNEDICICIESKVPGIHILMGNDGTCYNGVEFIKHSKSLNNVAEQLERELRGLKVEYCNKLYTHISNHLEETNGCVSDFNMLLISLIGCSSNSLFFS